MEEVFRGQERQWAHVIAKAWLDEEFKNRLFNDPRTVLKEHDIELPEGVRVNFVEGRANEITIPFPRKPDTATGSIEELEETLSAEVPNFIKFRG